MLKRYQIILNDWLADYIRNCAERYDMSFSEVIRLALCLCLGEQISRRFPNYKFGITEKEISKMRLKTGKDLEGHKLEEVHKIISKTYFEARKAMEFALKQEKKQSGKRKSK